jgi:hypothetical protein
MKPLAFGLIVICVIALGCSPKVRMEFVSKEESEYARWKRLFPYECSNKLEIDTLSMKAYSHETEYLSDFKNYKTDYYSRRPIYSDTDSSKLLYADEQYGDEARFTLFDQSGNSVINADIKAKELKLYSIYGKGHHLYSLKLILYNEPLQEAIISINSDERDINAEGEITSYLLVSSRRKEYLTAHSCFSTNNFSQSMDGKYISIRGVAYNTESGEIIHADSLVSKVSKRWPHMIHVISDSLMMITTNEPYYPKNRDTIPPFTDNLSLLLYQVGGGIIDSISYDGIMCGCACSDGGYFVNNSLISQQDSVLSIISAGPGLRLIKNQVPISSLVSAPTVHKGASNIFRYFTVNIRLRDIDLSDPAKTIYPTLIFGEKEGKVVYCRCYYRKEWQPQKIRKSLDRRR